MHAILGTSDSCIAVHPSDMCVALAILEAKVHVSIFVDELDDSNPLGVKGVGEVGIVGVPAAIANAVYHATGKRVRELPITLDKLLP
jgi:CO/xanthine dehydrogenase Mo-binding subunit